MYLLIWTVGAQIKIHYIYFNASSPDECKVFTDNLINLLKLLNVVNLLIKVCLSHICFLWRCCSAGSWSDIRDKLITFLALISMNKESIKV